MGLKLLLVLDHFPTFALPCAPLECKYSKYWPAEDKTSIVGGFGDRVVQTKWSALFSFLGASPWELDKSMALTNKQQSNGCM